MESMGYGCQKVVFFFFFKQKTAYEIYQCDWSSDVCSSDLDSGLFRFSPSVRGAGPEKSLP